MLLSFLSLSACYALFLGVTRSCSSGRSFMLYWCSLAMHSFATFLMPCPYQCPMAVLTSMSASHSKVSEQLEFTDLSLLCQLFFLFFQIQTLLTVCINYYSRRYDTKLIFKISSISKFRHLCSPSLKAWQCFPEL